MLNISFIDFQTSLKTLILSSDVCKDLKLYVNDTKNHISHIEKKWAQEDYLHLNNRFIFQEKGM